MITAGTSIRDYEVWGQLGGGGMGDVWLARHKLLGVPLILKTLKAIVVGTPEERYQRLLNEARLMARVHSDRVVRALDVGILGETPYLVQEYVDGIDLAELDRRRRHALDLGLPLWFVCLAVRRLAEGLSAAHNAGVLHRDIKPSNVFFSPEAGIKLGDFGVAFARAGSTMPEASGTVAFMAPEALRGEAVDRRTDVFGLGATAFDLRYASHPYPDVKVLLSGKARPPFPPPVGPEEAYFQHVVARMLAPDPAMRPASASASQRHLEMLSRSLRPLGRGALLGDGSIAFGDTRIYCESGDIAEATTEGIVSSSVPEMRMITSVGHALLCKAGLALEEEALAAGEQPLGACVVTGAGALPARRVLHAVSAWSEASCIARATSRALLAAEEEHLRTLAIPALGTGTARVTLESAAYAEASALRFHLVLGGSRLREVRFVLMGEDKLRAFREVLFDVLLQDVEGRGDHGLHHVAGPSDVVSYDAPTFVTPSVFRR